MTVVRWRLCGLRKQTSDKPGIDNHVAFLDIEAADGTSWGATLDNMPEVRYNQLNDGWEALRQWQDGPLPQWMYET